jgi:exopolysaccharide biosynthesis polyprenyl glycosylphosphotransferase
MKKSELIFAGILVPLDFLALLLAAMSAYQIRFADITADIRPIIFSLPFEDYLRIVVPVALFWLIIFAFAGLYTVKGFSKITSEASRVVLACSTGLVAVIIYMFFQRTLFSSRFIILAAWLLAIIYVVIARVFVRWLQRNLYARGIGTHKAILIGEEAASNHLAALIRQSKKLGIEISRRFKELSESSLREIRELARRRQADELIVADPDITRAQMLELYDIADEHHLTFKYAADLLGAKVLQTEVMEVGGIPVIEVKKTPLDGWGKIVKRLFDIIVSVALIILFSPVLLMTALAIKLDSHGPILYLDYRTGQYGKKFIFYKFRSMLAHLCDGEGPSATAAGNELLQKLTEDSMANTRAQEPLHKIKDDPRLTRVGKFIRRWSIDELPQLFNVLKGDISLAGPRPHMTLETARYERRHKKVLTIKPGLTGLAQISGRSDLSFEEEVKLDTYYIENWSFRRDIAILLRTPFAVLKKRKAA